jgi:predicted alpha/beta-hydrolase family hydrolase
MTPRGTPARGELLVDEPPRRPTATLVLAHGAGAPMDSDWMTDVARRLAEVARLRVVRFEFPYMAGRRPQRGDPGRKRPPDRSPKLQQHWHETIARVEDELRAPRAKLLIGGKSMGGRIASLVADEVGVAGLVCFGYPFHPPGKPESLRTEHLEDLSTRGLILQGERDPFGRPEEVATYGLAKTITVEWLPDGDHDLKPRKSSGHTHGENLAKAADAVAAWL